MVNRLPHCDPGLLEQLIGEGLSDKQHAEVVGHLDYCPSCQRSLEALAAEQNWWDQLRHLPAGIKTTGSANATAFHRDGPVGGRAVRNASGDEVCLDFLDRPDDPSNLGRLGPFTVTAVLGRGGMGIVLKAVDAALNRPVAIKVLAPHFAGSGAARKRFAREAQAAAAVVHDNVVGIHLVDEWRGLPYLVMSYVQGRSLQDRLDSDGPLELREILRIGMQVARGLAAAHAQGLVHRDIKPANILLENGVQRARITDFGLARAVDDASLTQSGVVAGTPQYMSPEQGRAEAIDHRADLFGLGSVLYAMCTGHAPFRADSAMAVLRRVCDEPARPVRELNADIPLWLAALIDKLHAKVPADRIQTAGEVASLLEQYLAHVQQPDKIPPATLAVPTPSTRLSKRRIRWLIALVALAALGAVTMVCWRPMAGYLGFEKSARQRPGASQTWAGQRSRDDPLQKSVDELREQAKSLNDELARGAPAAVRDRTDDMLQDARRELESISRELGTPAPRK
jgi:serine/threonine-protein kinase